MITVQFNLKDNNQLSIEFLYASGNCHHFKATWYEDDEMKTVNISTTLYRRSHRAVVEE